MSKETNEKKKNTEKGIAKEKDMKKNAGTKDTKVKKEKEEIEENRKEIKINVIKLLVIVLVIVIITYLLIAFTKKEEEPQLKPAPNTTIDYNLLNIERSDGNIVMENGTNAEVKDGVKRNTSSKLTEQKTYNDMIIKDARIEAAGGNSQFIATVENPFDKKIESEEVEVVFTNEDGSELARVETVFPELEPNSTAEINASTDIDITIAYDFYIQRK